MGIVLNGTGSFLPERTVSNKEMESIVETSDEWIRERTGIHRRHIATHETLLDMSCAAAREALSGINYDDVGLVITATATPDTIFPSTAAEIRRVLGLTNAVAFDMSTACSGFIYALWVAEGLIKTNGIRKALIVGAERMSRITDWSDRTTCVIFADGAGAAVIGADDASPGILGMHMQNYDDTHQVLYCHSQYVENPFCDEKPKLPHIVMNGQQVFKFAVKACPDAIEKALEKAGVAPEEIKYVVPHQANERILSSISKRLNIPLDRFIVTIQETGNTSAASIPIALDQMMRSGNVNKGDKIVLVGFGGGLSAGAAVIEI